MIKQLKKCQNSLRLYVKYKRQLNGEYKDRPDIIDNLIEEIADVYMCIEFLQILLGEDEFNKKIRFKIRKVYKSNRKQTLVLYRT